MRLYSVMDSPLIMGVSWPPTALSNGYYEYHPSTIFTTADHPLTRRLFPPSRYAYTGVVDEGPEFEDAVALVDGS